jgi:hypothetical protein
MEDITRERNSTKETINNTEKVTRRYNNEETIRKQHIPHKKIIVIHISNES